MLPLRGERRKAVERCRQLKGRCTISKHLLRRLAQSLMAPPPGLTLSPRFLAPGAVPGSVCHPVADPLRCSALCCINYAGSHTCCGTTLSPMGLTCCQCLMTGWRTISPVLPQLLRGSSTFPRQGQAEPQPSWLRCCKFSRRSTVGIRLSFGRPGLFAET